MKLTLDQIRRINTIVNEVVVAPIPVTVDIWQPKPGDWTIISNGKVLHSITMSSYANAGSERNTEKAAKLASERMTKANRLSALAHELEGEKEFTPYGTPGSNYYVYLHNVKGHNETWKIVTTFSYSPERVFMTKECAIKICEMLNSGEVVL